MAVKLFCDRCGAEIQRSDKLFLKHETKYHAMSLFHDEAKAADPVMWLLCDACGGSYMSWFEHPERDKEC